MERVNDELSYVLGVLYQMRAKVCASRELFEPDALTLIDEAIARYEAELEEVAAA